MRLDDHLAASGLATAARFNQVLARQRLKDGCAIEGHGMKTDEISANYAGQRVGLTVKLLEEEDGEPPTTVLIEGKPIALRMLAELLLAVAGESDDDGFFISPSGPGSLHFSNDSKLGVYIHRKD